MPMTAEPPANTIQVQTAFGSIVDVPESAMLTFVSPLLGFAALRRFALYQPAPGPLHWLQSLEDAKITFCLLNPFAGGLDPDYEITGADVCDIDASGEADIAVFTIVVLDSDPAKSRTNLRAPILVGKRSGKAKQVVFTDTKLSMRHMLIRPQAKTT